MVVGKVIISDPCIFY
uniref:Uncharacterized protein n=1 Tax=Anguilla anguilla TaxID=7936 RepID=A0A0E9R1Z5_ANGAN